MFSRKGGLLEMLGIVVRFVMEADIERFLGAGYYERVAGRKGSRNGYKPRTLKTVVGELRTKVPQVREGGFQPSIFERYGRSEKAVLIGMQEMYVKGVSTRKVGEIFEAMGGFTVSPATVSRAAAELDEGISTWRLRRLDGHDYRFLIVDARYERVRKDGKVVSMAVMIVSGINEEGQREVLGYYLGDSESETSWGDAFSDLKARGLKGVELVVSDAHKGLKAALTRHFQGAAWQRCRVHLMRDMMNHVGSRDRKELAGDLKTLYASEEKAQCMAAMEEIAVKWEKKAARMVKALREGFEDTLAVRGLPSAHQRRLGTTNMLERLNREMRRRTRVISIFPNEASCIRLFGALLMELDDQWRAETKRYLVMEQAA
jgi:transposase-like protein